MYSNLRALLGFTKWLQSCKGTYMAVINNVGLPVIAPATVFRLHIHGSGNHNVWVSPVLKLRIDLSLFIAMVLLAIKYIPIFDFTQIGFHCCFLGIHRLPVKNTQNIPPWKVLIVYVDPSPFKHSLLVQHGEEIRLWYPMIFRKCNVSMTTAIHLHQQNLLSWYKFILLLSQSSPTCVARYRCNTQQGVEIPKHGHSPVVISVMLSTEQ